MTKTTLADVANLYGNPTTGANTINANNALIEAAIENTLSRDGTSPNQMNADIDLNHNDLINVAELHADTVFVNGFNVTKAAVWYDGAGVPSPSLGITWDMYLNSSNGDVYGPKTDSGWGSPSANITGPQGPAGTGDMLKTTYDPQGKNADAFARANQTGTQAISTVVSLQSTLDGKATAAQGAKADTALQPASPLTGFSATPNSTVTATDTILSAFGKTQAQINSLVTNALNVVLTGLSTATNAAITSADSILSAFGKLQAQITGLSTSKLDKTGGTVSGALIATSGVYVDGDSITTDPSIYFRDPSNITRWRITKNATKDLAFSRYDSSGIIIDTPALLGAGGTSSFSQIALATALSVSNGGTGGTTQAAARAGIGVTAASTMSASVSNAWTPQLQFGAANVGMTTSTATGTYTRIGSLIFVKGRIVLTAKGSSTGVVTIAGLPIAAATENQAVSIASYANLASITAPFGQILSGSSSIGLLQHGAAAPANMTEANFTNTSVIVISGVYDISTLT